MAVCYPNLYYAFHDLFGLNIPALQAIHTVGFLIALAFLPGAWLWRYELKRKERIGELTYRLVHIRVGAPAGLFTLMLHFTIGFTAGYKLLYLATQEYIVTNASAYLFSSEGSLPGGLITGIIAAAVTWYTAKKDELPEPYVDVIEAYPHEGVTKSILVAGIFGVLGAKAFGIAEDWNHFIKAPLQSLLFSQGYAFLGGLIVAAFAVWGYFYRWGQQRIRLADALAPGLLLSYSLGRLGCQVSGDGDWGINHPAPNPWHWLPGWLWSYDYPHNAISRGIYMRDCTWDNYCYRLPVPVYPTPLYELLAGLLLTALLLWLRKHIRLAGRTSAVYLMMCATERFFIEKIRVDSRYDILGFHPTQAELLSVFLFTAGMILYFISPYLKVNKRPIMK